MARFDFSWGDVDYHQEAVDNLKTAIRSTKKLCAVSFLPCFPDALVIIMKTKSRFLDGRHTQFIFNFYVNRAK